MKQNRLGPVRKIVSGGQTGADRAALDWAIQHGIPHGGWCPRGREAEDGRISERYALTETPSDDPAQRTEWNARDSSGTVIFSISPYLTAGSLLTAEFADKYHRPYLHLHRGGSAQQSIELLAFLEEHQVEVLNVAGPRASIEPEVGDYVWDTFEGALLEACQRQGITMPDNEP